METLKHPACTIGWIARLSQLAFPKERNLNFSWEKSHWDNAMDKKIKRKKDFTHDREIMHLKDGTGEADLRGLEVER